MPTGQIRKALSGFYYVYDNGKLINVEEEVFLEIEENHL